MTLTRNVIRQFAPNEQSVENEKKASLAILSKLDGSRSASKKSRKDPTTTDDTLVNVRKAIRFTSNGRGAAALGRDLDKQNVRKKAAKSK